MIIVHGKHSEMALFVLWSIIACIQLCNGRYVIRNNEGEAAVEVIYQTRGTQVYTDELTGAYSYLSIWEPNNYENFFILGMRAEPNWEELVGSIEMARGVNDEMQRRYMRHPNDFTEVWRDQGGLGLLDVAFWRPVCDAGFQAVGDIAYACDWCGWPKPGSYLNRVMCIAEELLQHCTFTATPLWTNEGGWENEQGSVWEIDGGLSRFWMGNKGWGSLPNIGRAYCLKTPEFEDSTVPQVDTTPSLE